MEAISAVTARIAQIQTHIAALSTGQVTTPATSFSSGAATSFSSGTAALSSLGAGALFTTGTSAATSFAQALDAAVASSAPATSSTPTTAAVGSGQVNAKGVPVAFAGVYDNGKIPASELSDVAGAPGHKLWAPAARSLEAMIAAAKQAGVTIGVTDTYRSFESQVKVAREKGLYENGGLAAVPGTSKHGWGVATDLKLDGKALAWMKAHAAEFGFIDNVPRESWHWQYKPIN